MNVKFMVRFLGVLLTAFVCVWPWGARAEVKGAGDASAQSATEVELSDAQAHEATSIARQTMSPFCPGRTLADCPSEHATAWRQDIRRMLAEGKSAAEIQRTLEGRAGGNLSGIPNRESSFALPIGLALGAAVLLFAIFVWLRRKDDDPPGPDGESKNARAPSDGGSNAPAPKTVDDQRLRDELDVED